MELVGLMDSPFVRRVAVTAHLYGIPFTRRKLSVYGDADAWPGVNALMTVPLLVLDDGRRLIDSACICDYLDTRAPAGARLMPGQTDARVRVQQVVAHAALTCEKVGQLYREWAWRPEAARWPPAIARLHAQIATGLDWLDAECVDPDADDALTHAEVMAAITHSFVRFYAEPLALKLRPLPRLARLAARLEAGPAFLAHPLVD